MGILWVTAIGFILCLGLIGGTLFHFISKALDKDDSRRIDPLKNENDFRYEDKEP